jgi:FixJ family two-component response regulator
VEGGIKQQTIAVIDDDQCVLDVHTLIIEEAGYLVLPFLGAAEFLKVLNHGKIAIDAIVSDLNMPNISGKELLKKVKIENCKIPFILLSGEVSLKTLKNGAHEADAVLSKPVDDDLLAAIENLLDG